MRKTEILEIGCLNSCSLAQQGATIPGVNEMKYIIASTRFQTNLGCRGGKRDTKRPLRLQDGERQLTILVCQVHQRGVGILRINIRDIAQQWVTWRLWNG